jgi:magnesium transporter
MGGDFLLIYNTEQKEYKASDIKEVKENEVAWVRLLESDENEIIKILGGIFKCHPNLISTALKQETTMKVQQFNNHFYLTFSVVNISYQTIRMGVVIGKNYIITILNKPVGFLDDLYHEIQEVKNRMDYSGELLYQILYRCVEEYTKAIKRVEEDVLDIENKIIQNPQIQLSQEIFHLKKTMQKLRLVFVEELSTVNDLVRINFPNADNESIVFFENIYDNIHSVIDAIDIYRDSISSLVDMQMSMRGDKMNEIMKTLAVFSTIFLPLTFVAGIYGMNFEHFPELKWEWGYGFFWTVIIGVSFGMWIYFKNKKWF